MSMKKINLSESGLRQFVRTIIEQAENEVVKILSSEFLKMIKYTNSVDAILNLKKYKDKKVVIVGDLKISSNDKIKTLGRLHGVEGNLIVNNLSNLQSLGELEFVDGNLDISGTKVSSVEGVRVSGRISDWDTPIETKRLRRELQKRLDEANDRRESGEWDDIENNEIAAKAHAVLEFMSINGGINIMDEEAKSELEELNRRLELLNDQYNETDDDERIVSLTNEIEEVEDKITEINDNFYDVYDVLPNRYGFYGNMSTFNFRGQGNLGNMNNYAVGTTDEADEALKEYWVNMLDDIGIEGINQYLVESNIDGDKVAEEWEDYYEGDVRDNLDAYFNLDDLELSPEQESRKSDLESYINELETYIEEMEEKQSSLEDEIEDPEEYSQEYDRIKGLIEEAEKRKDDAQEEIDEMRGEVTDEMIDDVVQDKLYEIRNDPYDFLKNTMGYSSRDIANYVDMDELIKDLSRESDYGDLNGYDGTYDDIKIGGDYYIVMRID